MSLLSYRYIYITLLVEYPNNLVISVYVSSLPVAHLSDAPRRWLVDTGHSAGIQDKTTENSAWFFHVFGIQHRHARPRLNVSSERQLMI